MWFDPRIEPQLQPIQVMPVANDDIDINEIEIFVNERFNDNDIV